MWSFWLAVAHSYWLITFPCLSSSFSGPVSLDLEHFGIFPYHKEVAMLDGKKKIKLLLETAKLRSFEVIMAGNKKYRVIKS